MNAPDAAPRPPLPAGPYDVLLVDPPWRFGYHAEPSGLVSRPRRAVRGREPVARLAALPVARSAAPDALLFLWAPGPQLERALALLEAWGFPYNTVAFVWVKTSPRTGLPMMGMGYRTREGSECCLLGVRGRGVPRADKGVRQVVLAPRRADGLKPEAVYDGIERLTGPGRRRLELFARRRRPGWDAWGPDAPAAPDAREAA